MLQIRYNILTGEVTGWWGSRRKIKNYAKRRNRPNEKLITLNIDKPDKPMEAWLFDITTKKLIPNPDYIEPVPKRDLLAELEAMEKRIKELERR